jgi:hypothetical protein
LPEQGRVPGWDEVVAIARPNYAKLYFDYTADPVAFGPLQTYFFYPDGRGWTDGQRRVLSWVARPGTPCSTPRYGWTPLVWTLPGRNTSWH